mgnify:CR=1 FL=1
MRVRRKKQWNETLEVRLRNNSKSMSWYWKKEENVQRCPPCALLGTDVLQLLWAVHEVVGVSLGDDSALVGLLNKVFVTLLVGKVDGVVLGFEVEVGAMHVVGR